MPFQTIFEFSAPTKLIFGPGALARLPDVLPEGGKPLVVTDPGLVAAGIPAQVEKALADAGIVCAVFDEVEPNPRATTVHSGHERFQAEGCTCLIAVGGGSPMDVAKGVGILATHGGEILEYPGASGTPIEKPISHLVCIPTTYGTASEVTPFAVITDPDRKAKVTIASPLIMPKVGILDPVLSARLPFSVAGPTGMDALTHAIESYTNWLATPLTQTLAIGSIELIGAYVRQAAASDYDLEATEQMLLGSTIAGLAFTQTRVGIAHAMAHPLGGFFDVPHGVANAILLPHVMAYNLVACPDRFARIAVALGADVAGLTEVDAAREAVEAVRDLSEDLDIPRSLREVGVTEDMIPTLAEGSMISGSIVVNPRKATQADIEGIFRRAL